MNHIFVQDEKTLKLFQQKDFTNLTIAGDPRVERILERRRNSKETTSLHVPTLYKNVIVYGSVYTIDFEKIGDVIKRHPHYFHVIVPHDVSTSNIQQISNYLQIPMITSDKMSEAYNYVIINETGVLFDLYTLADAVYIGGGFGRGIHNILEPLSCGLPVSFGPKYQSFKEADELINLGLGTSVNNENDFDQYLINTIAHPGQEALASEYLSKNSGSTKIIASYIEQLM